MPAAQPLSAQIFALMSELDNLPPEKNTPELRDKIMSWVKDLPPIARPPELISRVARLFGLDEETIKDRIDPSRKKVDIEDLIPREGWLRDYVEYTRNTEPPTVYHFFAGYVAIATALGRHVYFRRGDKDLFPNMFVVLIGPSGRVRKTTACNLALKLINAIGGNVLADKLTPEAFIESFKDKSAAEGLIFAPELAVFLGKQKYQEGMVPMLTALADNPDKWRSGTIMRGEAELTNVALTFLGASTIDWVKHAIPKDAFGGGFMSRFLFVIQERTPRCFPEPPPLDEKVQRDLITRLRKITQVRGAFSRTETAYKWWDRWYREVTDKASDNKHFAGYLARIPDKVWQLAMVLVVSEMTSPSDPLVVEERHFRQSCAILEWVEGFMPATFDQFTESAIGNDQMQIIAQLKKAGGAEKHSPLLRKNIRKMNADMFRKCMDSLRTAGLVEFDQKTKEYFLTPEGWGQ